MARDFTTGKAQVVSTKDFNERVKRLLADKPEVSKPEPRVKAFKPNKPFTKP